MDKKELKGYLKMMLGMLVISAILLYCTCFFNRCNLIQAVQRSETSVSAGRSLENWLYMTRCVLIFYPGGLVYRDLRSNVHTIADEEVLYVLPLGYGKYRTFRIKTKEKTFAWGSMQGIIMRQKTMPSKDI